VLASLKAGQNNFRVPLPARFSCEEYLILAKD